MVLAVVVAIGVGFAAKTIIDNRSSQAQGTYKTVYCTYYDCHLNPGPGKAARTRKLRVDGYRACPETGIRFLHPASRPYWECLKK